MNLQTNVEYRRRIWGSILLLLLPACLCAQATIVGRVADRSGEPVSGVHIYCPEWDKGTVSDSVGHFRLECELPCTLEVTHLSYKKESYRITRETEYFLITLRNQYNNMKEVVVTGVAATGDVRSSSSLFDRIPAILGEQDILKYLATLPGIVTTNPFNSGIYVRGGNSHENGFMVNDSPIANPEHLTGILSTFDPYVLSSSTLYKSGFPARYNSYLASYLTMRPDAGNKQFHEGELSVGLISSTLKGKGPVFKNKVSYVFSARTSYLQQISRIYNREVEEQENNSPMPEYSFTDVTAAVDARLSDRWRISLFGLFTKDKLKMNLSDHVKYYFNWHTLSGNLKASYMPDEDGLWSFQAGARNAFSEGSATGTIPMGGGNLYYTLFSRLAYQRTLSPGVRLQLGGNYEYNCFETANREDGFGNLLFKSSEKYFHLYDVYADLDLRLNDRLMVNGGLNYQFYDGETTAHTLSPRLKISYVVPGFSFWADYAQTTQYLSLYPYFTVKTPVDIWNPLGKGNRPAVCHQYSLGSEYEIGRWGTLYGGVFYKNMQRVKDFTYDVKTSYAVMSDQMIEGKGDAKGFEVDFSLLYRTLYFRANYTLSESRRKFKEINNGEYFFPPYDVKHNVVVNFSWEISPAVMFNTLWTFSSGVHTTFPAGVVIAHNLTDIQDQPVIIPIYQDRYNYRLPDNHRLDASLDYAFRCRKLQMKLSVGAYNIYNQSNPTFVFFQPEENPGLGTRFIPKSQVVLPFIPYFSLRLKW